MYAYFDSAITVSFYMHLEHYRHDSDRLLICHEIAADDDTLSRAEWPMAFCGHAVFLDQVIFALVAGHVDGRADRARVGVRRQGQESLRRRCRARVSLRRGELIGLDLISDVFLARSWPTGASLCLCTPLRSQYARWLAFPCSF